MERFRSWIECNPLIIDGIVYGTSPKLKLFALNAKTGKEIWVFDPMEGQPFNMFGKGLNRGLAFWKDFKESRILFSVGSYIYAIDARTGKICKDFGEDGKVDLHIGLGERAKELFVTSNTPGIIYKDLFIVGSRVSETMGAAPGHIRAFDVRTGALKWIFHTIPQPGEFGYETWPKDAWKSIGGANCWGGFSLDLETGVVFAATASASWDLYGGDRTGDNLFANSIIALNAKTGERIWHYQTVHHDLWDRDLPAPPNLVTINLDGEEREVVAQITKSGFVFVLDRATGDPIFPIEEQPVPSSNLEGELVAKTQPIPTAPPPFSRQQLTVADLTTRTPEAHKYAKDIWEKTLKNNLYIPPSKQGAFVFPGMIGGGEWGGAAVNPSSNVLFVNSNELPYIIQMFDNKEEEMTGTPAEKGEILYSKFCSSCHAADRKGGALFSSPSLIGLKDKLDDKSIAQIIKMGKGSMPAFSYLKENQVDALVAFLTDKENAQIAEEKKAEVKQNNNSVHAGDVMPKLSADGKKIDDVQWKYPYLSKGYKPFKDQEGYPAIKPPFGTLSAIDLNKGTMLWQVPLGNDPDLDKIYQAPTGSENYGGPVLNASGLLFIAATKDEKIRAFSQETGEVVWEHDLPAGGYATPAIYGIDGKQYIIIACGGTRVGTKTGDAYVAFALPN